MLVQSENHSHFKRVGNVITEVLSTGEEKPVLLFLQHFINVEKLNETTIDYVNRYIEMFPHLVKTIVQEDNSGEQLSLF
jgi:hypothetical protein